ncbi:hypothetical protein [Rahnella bruchi]|uniref:hypothetical protein n=1 Tax=Rahnella bruchi TaxID=1510573 RepID=UPI0013C486AF|nr:hypothetical protein [Rahnella bruchi]
MMARVIAYTELSALSESSVIVIFQTTSRLWRSFFPAASSIEVILALLTLLLRNAPGHQGGETGFSLLGALALAGVVTALIAPEKGRKL